MIKGIGQTAAIGIFVCIAALIAAGMLMFLQPQTGDGSKLLKVRFADVGEVSVGTRVTFGGLPVGEVRSITQLTGAREDSEASREEVYIYELELSLDSSITVYSTDEIAIRTTGLLGAKSIAITPKHFPKGGKQPREIGSNEFMLGQPPSGSIEEVFQIMNNLAHKAEIALEEFTDFMDETGPTLNETMVVAKNLMSNIHGTFDNINESKLVDTMKISLGHFGSTMEKASKGLDVLDEKNTWDDFASTVNNFRSITDAVNQPDSLEGIVRNIDTLAADFGSLSNKISDSWTRVGPILENFEEVSNKTRQMVDDMYAGKGTAGEFLRNDSLYVRATAITSKVDTLLNDINHYGVLFHLDKSWQRTRLKRIKQIDNLRTASQFRNYFEEEMVNINTSLSRVGLLVSEAEDKGHAGELIGDKQFTKAFNDLMSQVDDLNKNLKLYSESLTSEREPACEPSRS